jgi:hypothetical protein
MVTLVGGEHPPAPAEELIVGHLELDIEPQAAQEQVASLGPLVAPRARGVGLCDPHELVLSEDLTPLRVV